MLPVVHLLQRKRQEAAKKSVNRSPFAKNPKVGLYGVQNNDPFACTECAVLIGVKDRKSTFRITMEYLINYSHCDLYFPVSECGNVELLTCRVRGKQVRGEVCRVARDETLVPSSNKDRFFKDTDDDEDAQQKVKGNARSNAKKQGAAAAEGDSATSSSTDNDEEKKRKIDALAADPSRKRAARNAKSLTGSEKEPTVYTFHVARVSEQVEGAAGFVVGAKVRVVLEVVTTNIVRDDGVFSVPFPLTVISRAPDFFNYEIEMRSNIRRIFSPNRSHPIFPYIKERKAEVALDITKDNPVRLGDYMFVLMIELGDPIVPECADPVAILVLVTAIGMILFYVLTKDLED